jgi:hypothetical protein
VLKAKDSELETLRKRERFVSAVFPMQEKASIYSPPRIIEKVVVQEKIVYQEKIVLQEVPMEKVIFRDREVPGPERLVEKVFIINTRESSDLCEYKDSKELLLEYKDAAHVLEEMSDIQILNMLATVACTIRPCLCTLKPKLYTLKQLACTMST